MDAVFTPDPLTHLKLMEDMVYDRYLAHVTDRQAIKGIHIIHQKFVLAETEGKKLDKEAAERKMLRAQRGEPEVEEQREQMEQRANEVVNRIFDDFLPHLENHEDKDRVEFSERRMFEDGVWTRYFHWFRKHPKNRRDLFQQLPKIRKNIASRRRRKYKVKGIRENRAQENPGAVEQREKEMRAVTKAVDLFCSVEFNDCDDDDIVSNREHRRKDTKIKQEWLDRHFAAEQRARENELKARRNVDMRPKTHLRLLREEAFDTYFKFLTSEQFCRFCCDHQEYFAMLLGTIEKLGKAMDKEEFQEAESMENRVKNALNTIFSGFHDKLEERVTGISNSITSHPLESKIMNDFHKRIFRLMAHDPSLWLQRYFEYRNEACRELRECSIFSTESSVKEAKSIEICSEVDSILNGIFPLYLYFD